MKPFSPIYFIKENKARCFLLMFLIFLGYAVYLGGIYVTNIWAYFDESAAYLKKFVLVYPAESDETLQNFREVSNQVQRKENVTYISLGEGNSLTTETIMGFEIDYLQYTFQSVEDFELFCEYMGITCDFHKLKNGSMIMSDLFVNNCGFEIGDKIDSGIQRNIYGDFSLDATTDETGYHAYYIDNGSDNESNMILNTGMNQAEFDTYIDALKSEYDIDICDFNSVRDDNHKDMDSFNRIYFFLVIMIAAIMAVMINAAFVGMYQRRQYEFAVYRAIGFRKWQMIRKIAGELICMDIIGLFVGGGVFFLGIYLLNHMYLYQKGLYLFYYHPVALTGLFICNISVIVPLILTRCRQLLRADICEY